MPPRGLAIFDLDGTLVDSRDDLAEAGNHARQAVGLPPLTRDELVASVGDGLERLIERLTPGLDAAARSQARQGFQAAYVQGCCRHTTPYAGIPDALGRLAEDGWVLAVATNKSLDFSERILSHCGLRHRFAAVRGGDRTRKPDPTSLREIISETGTQGVPGWMIGDHHTDIEAGHAAGLRVAWCEWGFGRRQGLAVERMVANPRALPQVLEQAV